MPRSRCIRRWLRSATSPDSATVTLSWPRPPFLLLAGNTAAYRDRTATILVERLPPVIAALEGAGGQIIDGPSPAPNGDRLIARHPDGSVFEYIETGPA